MLCSLSNTVNSSPECSTVTVLGTPFVSLVTEPSVLPVRFAKSNRARDFVGILPVAMVNQLDFKVDDFFHRRIVRLLSVAAKGYQQESEEK